MPLRVQACSHWRPLGGSGQAPGHRGIWAEDQDSRSALPAWLPRASLGGLNLGYRHPPGLGFPSCGGPGPRAGAGRALLLRILPSVQRGRPTGPVPGSGTLGWHPGLPSCCSAFPSSLTAALRLTPPFAAGRRGRGRLGCRLVWGLSREFQGCSCREPQTQTPAGWLLAQGLPAPGHLVPIWAPGHIWRLNHRQQWVGPGVLLNG